ncbi:MAG: lysylphosphatidylglycerol synthase domain-containing protein [Bacteroidales bacterium]|nr:lysylphosphatidylglycerol synthase domain-containing protein [Bacteroidales bacterium]MDG1902499.1 lysylphosphatidylglycerol synthase domain-containing protein [Bacteroidales bacterium]MDG2081969.1 lysylphosphatidylglycerol synthase domain-containing protein [Bacteroidales bacterium]
MKTKLRKTYNFIIRFLVVACTAIFIYDQLVFRKDISSLIEYFDKVTYGFWSDFILISVLLLIPVNILFEGIKWQYLMRKLERISIYTALKGVLAGISVSMIMPNRIGDYLGRVFILKKADRFQAVLATILGSLAQLLTTIIIGLIGVILFIPDYFNINIVLNYWIYIGIIMGVVITIVVLVFFYLNFSVFSVIIKKISGKYYDKIQRYSNVFSWYNQKELMNVLLLSIFRYLIFSMQFYLLLKVFGVDIDYPVAMMLISIVYLVMAIIPTVALTEIGVRGSVSLYIFKQYFDTLDKWQPEVSLGVLSASSFLWLCNLILPAILGAGFVFSLKFFRKSNGS